MNTELVVGAAVTLLGLLGYVAGIYVAYPGRSFSLAAVMVGLTLVLIGRSLRPEGTAS